MNRPNIPRGPNGEPVALTVVRIHATSDEIQEALDRVARRIERQRRDQVNPTQPKNGGRSC